MEQKKYDTESLRIETRLTPSEILLTPDKNLRTLRDHLKDPNITEYDTWCRHSD